MVKPVDPAALDPSTLRLTERGAKEVFEASLADMLHAMHMPSEEFDDKDLETLVLAGRMAEEADRRGPPGSRIWRALNRRWSPFWSVPLINVCGRNIGFIRIHHHGGG